MLKMGTSLTTQKSQLSNRSVRGLKTKVTIPGMVERRRGEIEGSIAEMLNVKIVTRVHLQKENSELLLRLLAILRSLSYTMQCTRS